MNLKPAVLQQPHYCTKEQPGLSEGFPKQTRTPGLPSASAEPRDTFSSDGVWDSELSTAQALSWAQTLLPSANCSWTLSHGSLDMNWLQPVNWWCTNHSLLPLPPLCPVTSSLTARKSCWQQSPTLYFYSLLKKPLILHINDQQSLSRKHLACELCAIDTKSRG